MGNRKTRFTVFLSALAMLLATIGFAHEGGKRFHGTVKSVDSVSLTIVTKTNDTVTIHLLPSTKLVKSGQPASLQDVSAGARVVIHAKRDGQSWEAEEVEVGDSAQKQ